MDLLDVLGKVDPGYSQLRGKYLGKWISVPSRRCL
jgi:hypothetical protein